MYDMLKRDCHGGARSLFIRLYETFLKVIFPERFIENQIGPLVSWSWGKGVHKINQFQNDFVQS